MAKTPKDYNSDYMSRKMDEQLEQIENNLSALYANASYEVNAEWKRFSDTFKEKDELMQKKVAEGKMTDADYSIWRQRQILQNDLYKASVDKMTNTLVKADKAAMAIVNGELPKVVAESYNFGQALGWKAADDAGLSVGTFQIYNAKSVETILRDNPNLLKEVDVPEDEKWNKDHINREITTGILKGESIPKIADRLARVTNMDKNAATRNARTAMTGAENLGRYETSKNLRSKGIPVDDVWSATHDSRTRESHILLDGTKRDEKTGLFGEGIILKPIRFAGDPDGDPEEIYNCRCRTGIVLQGIDHSQDEDLYAEFMSKNFPEDWYGEKDVKGVKEQREAKEIAFQENKAKAISPVDRQKIAEGLAEPPPSYPVATNREEAIEILDNMFGTVSRGTQYLNEDVLVASTNKLSELDARFHASSVGQSRMAFTTDTTKDIASVTQRLGSVGSVRLNVNPSYFHMNTDQWNELVERKTKENWWMPIAPENYVVETITHEYGHMIENMIINTPEFAKESMDRFVADKSKEHKDSATWWLTSVEAKQDEIKAQIISIAKEKDPDFDYNDYISDYGRKNSAEFFAECFMNSQLGRSNALGDAMNVYLERQGL